MSVLFSPFTVRGMTLRNRAVVAPMLMAAATEGHASDFHLVHIGRFALGGAGLIVMESTKVERRGRGTAGDLGLWDDGHVEPLRRIVDFAHAHGAKIGIQLGHTGRKSGLSLTEPGFDMVGPSAIAHNADLPAPRALEPGEIPGVIEAFVAAARRADAAGFDMVELHGAHGYLLHSFLSPHANQRTDRYGGSDENRERLMLEVTEAVRAALPAEKPLFMRLSCEDQAGLGPAELMPVIAKLKQRGVDVIDCSTGGMRDNMKDLPGVHPDAYGYQVRYAEAIRQQAGIPTMAVGHIVHAHHAEQILTEGRADLVAIAREMLYNPNWAMDAAQKLGEDPDFSLTAPNMAYFLASRRRRLKGQPSTFGLDNEPFVLPSL